MLLRSFRPMSLAPAFKRSLDLWGSREVDIMNSGKDIFVNLMNNRPARRNPFAKSR
ncbi:MAG: hypothetical protein NTY15_19735 [Planctomycetota bacterium]|nr:hypothetical protein [Planctomycetota bacterium]